MLLQLLLMKCLIDLPGFVLKMFVSIAIILAGMGIFIFFWRIIFFLFLLFFLTLQQLSLYSSLTNINIVEYNSKSFPKKNKTYRDDLKWTY